MTYYMSFIFLTAFAFLNMVIDSVVNVMEEEHRASREDKEPSMRDLQKELKEMKEMLSELQKK